MDETDRIRLRERVKELTALHKTARLLQDYQQPSDEVMRKIVALLPEAWQFPDVAAARIEFDGDEFCSEEFRETPWRQRSDFALSSGRRGRITVVYREERPSAFEGPFLKEERDLLDSLAEMLRSHLEQVQAHEALREARDALEAQVLARTADLRRLASQLTLAEEKERRRIASDLHDHIGQALAVIRLRVREIHGNAVFSGFEEAFGEILFLLDQTIRYTRDLTGEISPPVLYELGLEQALEWLAEYFTSRHRFRVRFRRRGRVLKLPEEKAVMLFKSARELIFNCLKHSGSAEALVELQWQRDGLLLRVADQGRGFDPTGPSVPGAAGFGLAGIRERFGDLGGSVTIESAPGRGCRVTLVLARFSPEDP